MDLTPSSIADSVENTYKRIKRFVTATPLYHSKEFSTNKCTLYLKSENLQYTGSFKLRGAASKITALAQSGVEKVITASTGNHGLAVAHILTQLKIDGEIFVPHTIEDAKLSRLEQYAVQLTKAGEDSVEAEREARKYATLHGIPFISPYNDKSVIEGQATIGKELLNQLDTIDNIFITIGGGGLVSGVASVLKSRFPQLQVFGCQPHNSPVMYESIIKGKILDMESKPTLSDGSAGGIEDGSITFELCKELIDDFVLVSEDEIRVAIKDLFQSQRLVVEGAAGVALASYHKMKAQLKGNTVVLLCGGNINTDTWKSIIA